MLNINISSYTNGHTISSRSNLLKPICCYLIAIFCVGNTGLAQLSPCGTDHTYFEKGMKDPDFRYRMAKHFETMQLAQEKVQKNDNSDVVIPVVVHFQEGVVPDSAQDCAVRLVTEQLYRLAEDLDTLSFMKPDDIDCIIRMDNYVGVGLGRPSFQFRLAVKNHPSGWNLVDGDPAVSFGDPRINISGFVDETITLDQVGNGDWYGYLNIYVGQGATTADGSIKGGQSPIAGTFNGMDGIYIESALFGSKILGGIACQGMISNNNRSLISPADDGQTLTHELGHYLGLAHVWGDMPGMTDGFDCTSNDNVQDTPLMNNDGSSVTQPCGEPIQNDCDDTGNVLFLVGNVFFDPPDLWPSFMTYAGDGCRCMFSEGQVNVMEQLISAYAVIYPNSADQIGEVVQTTIEPPNTTVLNADNVEITFEYSATGAGNNPTVAWSFEGAGVYPSYSYEKKPKVIVRSSGTVTVRLYVSNNSQFDTAIATYDIEVLFPDGEGSQPDTDIQEKIVAMTEPGLAAESAFGYSVDIYDDVIVVGTPFEDVHASDSGSAFVFRLLNGEWTQEARLIPPTGEAGDNFGYSVAVEANKILIGARFQQSSTLFVNNFGAAFYYEYDGSSWYLAKELPLGGAPLVLQPSRFGESVLIDGDYLLMGAPKGASTGYPVSLGAIYYVDINRIDDVFYSGLALRSPNIGTEDELGTDLALFGETLVSGAPDSEINGLTQAGQIYTYNFDPINNSNLGFEQEAMYTAEIPVNRDKFGYRVDIDQSTIFVTSKDAENASGDDIGAVDVFTKTGSTWSFSERLISPDDESGSEFGSDLLIKGNLGLIGASWAENQDGNQTGTVHLLEKSAGNWDFQHKIYAIDGNTLDRFGHALAMSDDYLVIGSPFNDENANDAGAVYIIPTDKLYCPGVVSSTDTVSSVIDIYGEFIHGKSVVGSTGDLNFISGHSASLYSGFEVENGATFSVVLEACVSVPISN